MKIDYLQPIKGVQLDVSQSPDDVFSQSLLGQGFVIYPTEPLVYSLIDGVISLILPTKHAIVIRHESGIHMMIHVGFGSVGLKGIGFTIHAPLNQAVKQGDLILEFDLDYLSQHATSIATPVVFIEKKNIQILSSTLINDLFHMEIEVIS